MQNGLLSRKTHGLDSNYQVSTTHGSWVMSSPMIKMKGRLKPSLNTKARHLKHHHASARTQEDESSNLHLSRRRGHRNGKMSLRGSNGSSARRIVGAQHNRASGSRRCFQGVSGQGQQAGNSESSCSEAQSLHRLTASRPRAAFPLSHSRGC